MEKEEKSAEISQITENSRVHCINNINLKNDETLTVTYGSDKISVKIETSNTVNDSDSAINTDSGSETGKLPEADSMIRANLYVNTLFFVTGATDQMTNQPFFNL